MKIKIHLTLQELKENYINHLQQEGEFDVNSIVIDDLPESKANWTWVNPVPLSGGGAGPQPNTVWCGDKPNYSAACGALDIN